MLPDGIYECVIVDAIDEDDATHIELAISSGEHRGDVVRVRATQLARDAIELLALPARLTVRDGEPSVALDD